MESLGALARLTVLQPPTYAELEKALQAAADRGEPFDVVHFDGHGIYDRRQGLGGLCFEALDGERPDERPLDTVFADRLAGLFRQHRIPLVFLDACQTAVEEKPTASVAAKLLDEGVTSVVAMSHSVLVETARRFVKAFYEELAQGARVGRAMLAGQRALFDDPRRGKTRRSACGICRYPGAPPGRSSGGRSSALSTMATPPSSGRLGGSWRTSNAPPARPKPRRRPGGGRSRPIWPIAGPGGVSQSNQAQLFALVAQAIQEKAEERAAQQLNELLEPGDPPTFTALIRQLQRILGGERDPALAEEPELDYMNAAELRLLLEGVGAGDGPTP